MKRFKVTWTHTDRKNINGRRYASGCFENAIEKLGGRYLPVYHSVEAIKDGVDPIGIGHSLNFENNSLTMEIELFNNALEVDCSSFDFCIAGKGTSEWKESEGVGYHEVQPDDYQFIATYMNKKSAFPVSMERVITSKDE